MNKTIDELDLADIPTAVPTRRRGWSVQFIWIVPIVAALIGGWLVVKGILDKGPTITIMFKTAEGLEAGKTKIKYKNVDVGEVKMITLSKDRHSVVATAELVKEAEPYLVEDTRFWVVRPRIAGGQVCRGQKLGHLKDPLPPDWLAQHLCRRCGPGARPAAG